MCSKSSSATPQRFPSGFQNLNAKAQRIAKGFL